MGDLPTITTYRGQVIRDLPNDDLINIILEMIVENHRTQEMHRLEIEGWKMLVEVGGRE
ncbi:hypothetical protein OIV19_17460 [Brucella sp. HL-2]|nr:hypothetical protein [Brucella sp. HL-2]MCV9909388.1 hypothetical protein [Brucella sp. HL-2]